jgi:hypothetical protein
VGEDRGSKEMDGCFLTDVGFGEDRGGSVMKVTSSLSS